MGADAHHTILLVLVYLFFASQVLYTLTFVIEIYFLSLPTHFVDMDEPITEPESEYPYIVLFYPVLRELESTMKTTFHSLADIDYPKDRFEIVAIPNSNDHETIANLERLAQQFPFVKLMSVPPTTDPSWDLI